MGKHSKRDKVRKEVKIELIQDEVHDFLRTVKDDLLLLRKLDFKRPLRSEVRVASSILRRLLHELMLLNAWRLCSLPDEPRFTAVDLDAMLACVDVKYIHYGYAGGATTDGAQHRGYVLFEIPKAEVDAEGKDAATQRVTAKMGTPDTRQFPLSEFCTSSCVASGAGRVSRVAVVCYVANKLGGVHWDKRRSEWTDPVGSRQRLLDEAHLIVGRLSAPLYETLSIAQAVAESDDVTRLIDVIDTIAPEEEGSISVLKFREGRSGKYANMAFNARAAPEDKI